VSSLFPVLSFKCNMLSHPYGHKMQLF
jgi:hypothetical protein